MTVAKSACYMDFVQAMPEKIQLVAMQPVYKSLQKKAIFFVLQGKFQSKAVFEIYAPTCI